MTNVVKSSLALLVLSAAAAFPVQAQTFSKVFGKPTIRVNESTTLTFTIPNPNLTPLSFGFNDPLPAALQGISFGANSCGGTPIVTPTNISLGGATAPPGGCSIVFTVKGIGLDTGATNVATGTNAPGFGDLNGAIASANFAVLFPDFTKAFTGPSLLPGPAPTIPRNGITKLTFTLADNTGTDLPSFGWTDPLPSGFTVVSAPANACGGSVNAPVGGTSISLTGGSLLNTQSCTLEVMVKGSQSTSLLNPTPNTVTGNGDLAGVNAVGFVNVRNPTFSKVFSPSTIALNQISTLTFTIDNATGTNLTQIGFTDLLPTGLVVDGAATTNTCSLVVTGTPGNINVSGGTVNTGSSCTLSVPVRATGGTPALKQNNANGAGDLLGLPAPANLNVNTPIFTKTAGTPTVAFDENTTFTLFVNNTTGVALANFGFTDNLPAGLSLVSVTGNTCTGTLTPTLGNPGSVTLTGSSLAIAASCSMVLNVKGVALGAQLNTANGTGELLSINPGATVTVIPKPPTFTKTFGAPVIALNQNTTLTFNIGNHTGGALSNIGFGDTLPVGLVYVSTVSNGCTPPGTLNIVTGPPSILTLANVALANNTDCVIVVNVKGVSAGVKNNTADGAGDLINLHATASVEVKLPTFTKSFGSPIVFQNGTTTLTFNIGNNTGVALASVNFSDTLPAGLLYVSTGPNSCNGTFNAVVGPPSVLTLTGASLSSPGNCAITVTVKGTAIGQKDNIAFGSGALDGINATDSTNVVASGDDIDFSKQFSAPSAPVNSNVNLTFQLTNHSGSGANQLGFTDTLPAGMTVVLGAPPNTNTCGGSVTAPIGGNTITLNNGNLPDTLSCSITITVQSSTPGQKDNIAFGTGILTGKQAPASILITQPVFSKVFSPNSTTVGTVVKLTFTIPNNTGAPIAVGFTDPLPLNLVVATPPNVSSAGCGAGVFNPALVGNATSLTFTGGTVLANSNCVISIDVVNTAPGPKHNIATGTGAILGQLAIADLDAFDAPSDAFQIRYFSNLNIGESYINITNYGGASTTALPVQNGNLCVNAYTYSPDEQLISCCSCNVTPNGLNSLQVKSDLASNTLTPVLPSSVVVKLLATRQSGTCNAATIVRGDLRAGLAAWASTLHAAPVTGGTPSGSYNMTETPFSRATLSDAELIRMTQMCAYIQANGSGYGICKSCKMGGLGASAK